MGMNLSLEKKSIVEGRLNKNELYFFFKQKNKPERIPVQPAFAKSNLFFIKYKKALLGTTKNNWYPQAKYLSMPWQLRQA